VLEIFTLGLTTGTTPTTYDSASNVSRLQMAAFLSRTVDATLKRGDAGAALGKFWTPAGINAAGLTAVGDFPFFVRSDGADLWVSNNNSSTVSRVRASDGRVLETWTGATGAAGVLVAMGRVFVTGQTVPGALYMIDPSLPAGAVTTMATDLGGVPIGLAFDGARIWTANGSGGVGSVSIITPGGAPPWTTTTVTSGFQVLRGMIYDGANIWVSVYTANNLLKLDPNGAILQTTTVGDAPGFPAFDGENIWVPNALSFSTSVVRASTGVVLQNLPGNSQNFPFAAAFDGERILVTNSSSPNGNGVSLWKAADLTPLGFVATGPSSFPSGACSDGVSFWVALSGKDQLARF
jgi:DNA-binding beta-propeller fold protein YncE